MDTTEMREQRFARRRAAERFAALLRENHGLDVAIRPVLDRRTTTGEAWIASYKWPMKRSEKRIERTRIAYGARYNLWRLPNIFGAGPAWEITADATRIGGPYRSRGVAMAEFAAVTGDDEAGRRAERMADPCER